MRKLLLIILLAGVILAIIISIGRIPARNFTLNRDDGTIVKVGRGMLRYDISDIFRKQFRINFSAEALTLSRGIEAPKGFLPSFILPEPQSQITFDNVAASLNFKKGAIELENIQLIGNDITITGSGKSIGKRSINYTFILTPSKETAKKLLARLGNPTENTPINNKIILKIYGEPGYPFVHVISDKFRLSFKVGNKAN